MLSFWKACVRRRCSSPAHAWFDLRLRRLMCRRGGRPRSASDQKAAELIAKVTRTVHYAHQHGILHRDIKPGNILLDGKGEPHLTDFGLARLVETESTMTRTLDVLGTPSYMAPEQAMGNNAAV